LSKLHQGTNDVALIAILSAILLVQQIALSFLPNVQTTVLLIVLYTKVLGFKKTTLIIMIHVILYNTLSPFGAVIPLHFISMFVGYMIIPISLQTIFKKLKSPLQLASAGLLFGFLYGWAFIPVSVFVLGIPFMTYFLMDLPFEMVMAVSNFLSIYWLYEPLSKLLIVQTAHYYLETK